MHAGAGGRQNSRRIIDFHASRALSTVCFPWTMMDDADRPPRPNGGRASALRSGIGPWSLGDARASPLLEDIAPRSRFRREVLCAHLAFLVVAQTNLDGRPYSRALPGIRLSALSRRASLPSNVCTYHDAEATTNAPPSCYALALI